MGWRKFTQRAGEFAYASGRYFGWIAGFLGVFVPVGNYFATSESASALITSITVSITFWLVLGLSVWREVVSARKRKYANISKHVGLMHTKCKELLGVLYYEAKNNELSKNALKRLFIDKVTSILDDLRHTFELVSGTSCRVCIKFVEFRNNEGFAVTLARDSASAREKEESDRKRSENSSDPIKENEDFDIIFNEEQPDMKIFFENNLPERLGYRNSSFKECGKDFVYANWAEPSRGKRYNLWPLSYKSTISWGIMDRDPPLSDTYPKCLAFLSVDSESPGVFRERWDEHIGLSLASALYYPIYLYAKLSRQPRKHEAVNGS